MPEAIPELVYVIGLFFAIVGYITARGLLATWTHSLGFVFQWLAVHLRFSTHLPFGPKHIDFGAPFRVVDAWAVTALQNWCDGAEIQMAYCLHGMAKVALYTAQAIDFLTRETVHAFERLNHVKLRQFLKLFALPLLLPLLLPKLIKAILPHVHAIVYKPVQIIYRTIPHTAARVAHKVAAVALPYPHAIPRIQREIVGLTKRNLRLSKRLHKVEGLFGVAVMAAAMANVLGLPNWRCLTRGNVGKTARRLCGLSPHALEDFLGLLVDVLILENICNVVTLMEDGFGLIQGPLNDFIGTAEAQFVHCDYQLVGPLPDVQLSLPPVTGLVLSLP